LQDCAGAGAKLICHGKQGGVFALTAHSRERARGGARASSAVENLASQIVRMHINAGEE
jgi:hypothetical protein